MYLQHIRFPLRCSACTQRRHYHCDTLSFRSARKQTPIDSFCLQPHSFSDHTIDRPLNLGPNFVQGSPTQPPFALPHLSRPTFPLPKALTDHYPVIPNTWHFVSSSLLAQCCVQPRPRSQLCLDGTSLGLFRLANPVLAHNTTLSASCPPSNPQST